MTIFSCKGCVAPKRHPGCHDHCPEYIKEKSEYEERKAVVGRKNAISGGVYAQKAAGVNRAYRRNKPLQSGWKRKR